MGSMRAILLFCTIFLCAAFVYIMGVLGDDPLRGPDPRVCAGTLEIASDREIIDAALALAAARAHNGRQPYPSAAALKASDPYIRFSSDWHWQRWQEDRSVRMDLLNAGLQYAYIVSVAYRTSPGGEKPYTIETYRIDECARPIGNGEPVSSGAWSPTTYERAKARLDLAS